VGGELLKTVSTRISHMLSKRGDCARFFRYDKCLASTTQKREFKKRI